MNIQIWTAGHNSLWSVIGRRAPVNRHWSFVLGMAARPMTDDE